MKTATKMSDRFPNKFKYLKKKKKKKKYGFGPGTVNMAGMELSVSWLMAYGRWVEG